MRFTILLLSFGLITNEGFSRPSQAAGNGEEYVEYEEKNSAADEYLHDKPEKEVEARSEIQDEDARSHASYKQSVNNNEYENLMEDRINKNENRDQAEEEPFSDHRKSNPGLDETEDEDLLRPPNTRFNTFKRNQNNEYRSGNREIALNDGNVMDSNRRIVKDKSEYNNEAIETREEPLYKQITYYNKVQGDLFHKKKPNSVYNSNRDRRETIGNQQENHDGNKNKEKKEAENSNEDSITAIKRNIKKLSREELEDLLNSLSDDKKALLNKIIGTKIANDNVNKREITKKAGAVEESNFFENSHSDLNKLESGSSIDSISSVSQSETTESTKQSESGDASKTKTPESSDNTLSNSESKDDVSDVNLNINQESVQSTDAVASELKDSVGKETINKRETKFEDVSSDKSEVIEDYDSGKDVNWSELMKDEIELHKTYSNLNKRDLDDYSNTADVKSLQDSFPYYEAENPKSSGSQMAPLIRVKRTNSNGKRADRNPGNMKVPFFPAAVNDEDDAEKDEFDDGSNFENSYNYEKVGKEGIHRKDFSCYSDYNMPSSNKNMLGVRSKSKFKPETDSAKIGSDTDNVLSNLEGVDDNLMYKNEVRRKRVADDANFNKLQHESSDENAPEGSADENDMTDSLSKNNVARYQDPDALGFIQRTSDEEVGRYKRIRRLKPTQENIQKT